MNSINLTNSIVREVSIENDSKRQRVNADTAAYVNKSQPSFKQKSEFSLITEKDNLTEITDEITEKNDSTKITDEMRRRIGIIHKKLKERRRISAVCYELRCSTSFLFKAKTNTKVLSLGVLKRLEIIAARELGRGTVNLTNPSKDLFPPTDTPDFFSDRVTLLDPTIFSLSPVPYINNKGSYELLFDNFKM